MTTPVGALAFAVLLLGICVVLCLVLVRWSRQRLLDGDRCYGADVLIELCTEQKAWPLKVRFLSEAPSIRLVEDFVSPGEARHLIETYSDRLSRSTVAAAVGDEVTSSRTSTSSFLPEGAVDPVVAALENRAALLTGLPVPHWETLQLTHYVSGQEYHPHFDFFADSDNNRAVTIFIYLNDVSEDHGGVTEFVRAGLRVRPVLGRAVVWFNCAARGREVVCDEATEHAGRAPSAGEKYGLNMWARTMPYR